VKARRTPRQRHDAQMASARERIVPALLTLPEAAVYLGLTFAALMDRVYRTCEIPSVRLPGKGERRSRRVRRVDLDALIAKGFIPSFEQQQHSSARLPALRRV